MNKPEAEEIRHFFSVLERYQAGNASAEETEFVERYLQVLDHRSPEPENFESYKDEIGKEIKHQLLESIQREKAPPVIHRVHFLRRNWWAAAAAAMLLSAGGYLLLRQPQPPQQVIAAAPADKLPGKNGAVLTLANGQQVLLDSLGNGQIAVQSGATLVMQDGALQYDSESAGEAAYNTVSTPKGRQFRITLPDGSVVWLNAASSITYLTRFDGAERLVKITGEAYFEIAPKVNQPFKVRLNERTEIVVLGTKFNVSAYSDEPGIYTTLLSGAVKVLNAGTSKILQPGQQAGIAAGSRDIAVKAVNTDEAIAWKNGSFTFSDADIHTVMRQLARWYDIEVKFEGEIPQATFSGEIDRSLTLQQVLKGLTAQSIHYRLENGNTLVIQP